MPAEAKPISGRAKVLLQLCQQGKGEVYGEQLADITIFDTNFFFDVQGSFEMQAEIQAYCDIARQYKAQSALDRWRQRPDEVDAEIAFDNYKILNPRISYAELHALWYDCCALKARNMIERITGAEWYLVPGEKVSEILYELRLLTLDIPCETGRPFPYDRVILGWPVTPDEQTFMAHISSGLSNLVELYRRGRHVDIGLAAYPGRLHEHLLQNLIMRTSEWGLSLEDILTSEEEISDIALKAEAEHAASLN